MSALIMLHLGRGLCQAYTPDIIHAPFNDGYCRGFLAVPLVMLPTAMLPAAPISGEGVFTARFMAGGTNVALPVARFISLEVVEGPRATLRQRTGVTMMRIIAVVDVAVKAAMAVEPGAGSDKHIAHEPIGPVVAIGSAVVGRIVEVPVGAYGRPANADADGNLGRRVGRRREGTGQHENGENCESKDFNFEHVFSLIRLELHSELRVETEKQSFNLDERAPKS